MGINFPNAPTVGQLYPQPPVLGQPVYKWDGTKWVSTGPTGAFSIYVQDTPPTGAAANSLWWESDTGLLYLYYNDGDSTQWVAAVPPVSNAALYAVRYDQAQSLTTAQQVQARQNIYATPFDALAYNGMQVNGNMEVSQPNGTGAVAIPSGAPAFSVDGWWVFPNNCAVSAQQVADAPPGYTASVKVSVTTADPSPAAGDFLQLYQNIEGCRISRLAFGSASAFAVSIGFWIKVNRPGTYSASVTNGAGSRSYPFSFVVNASATWQYVTVTIPGDTAGSWTLGNTAGLALHFCMMAGATYLGTANQWQSANVIGVPGTINGAAATTDYMQITGVVMLPGIELPSATRAPFIMRTIDLEMPICRRYFYNGVPPVKGYVNNGSASLMRLAARHPVSMRATPTLTLLSPLPIYDGTVATTLTAIGANESTPEVLEFEATAAISTMTGRSVGTYQSAGGNMNVDARL